MGKIFVALFLVWAWGSAFAAVSLTIPATEASNQPFLARGTLTRLGTELSEFVAVPEAGTYQITVRASGRAKNGLWPVLAVVVDGFAIGHGSVESASPADFRFETRLEKGTWTIGAQLLNESDGLFDSVALQLESISIAPSEGDATPKKSTSAAWMADAQARDAAVLAASDAEIAKHRLGDLRLEIVDAAGKPVADAKVEATQSQHAFLFGCNIAGLGQFNDRVKDAAYADQFAAIFNYATVPLYWRYFEPVQGRRDYRRVDGMVDWCVAHDIAMKGHPLLWDSEHGVPTWMTKQPEAAKQRAHVEDMLGHYGDRVKFWEVVNEPANHPGVTLSPAQEWARAKAPNAVLVVNEYGPFYNGHPAFRDLLAAAKKDDVPFDAVGIQAHAPPDMAFPLARVRQVLDSYAALGKRVHITEFTPPSTGGAASGAVWRGDWTEAMQAQYAEELYRVLFAHPAVDAISWWDFSDQGAWIKDGGLLRADASPKPAYTRLLKLLRETWHTAEKGTTDAQGQFLLHGYFGTYAVKVSQGGKTVTQSIPLTPDAKGSVRVVMQ